LIEQDGRGALAPGAIANLVDEVGFAAVNSQGCGAMVSVDMNIAFLSPAKLGDELEIRSRALGHRGAYSGTHVLLRNKATGQVVAEGRHSLFGNLKSKI
jgi:acyl-coenzyme A thioesterase 13